MLMNRIILILLGGFLFQTYVKGQDKIYFTSGNTSCQIIEITATSVTYLPLQSSKSVTKYVDKIVLIFNDKGVYLIPSKTDFSLAKNKELIKKFLHHEPRITTTDFLYKNDNTVATGQISKEDKTLVYLVDGTKIDKKSVAVIIYKNGEHQILAPVQKAADILWSQSEKNVIPKQANTTSKKVDTIADDTKKTKNPSPDTETKQMDTSLKKEPIPLAPSPSLQAANNDSPPLYDKERFQKKADEKIKLFTTYVKIILEKTSDEEKINKTIDQCFSLFVNENAIVEVSSLNRDPVKRKIRDYLVHIKKVPYDKIEVVWRNVSYVSDIHKAPDGNYYGNITFEQEFKGYKDGIIIYHDVTTKKADVILKTYEKIVDGKTEILWDVLLGNIGVESTKSI